MVGSSPAMVLHRWLKGNGGVCDFFFVRVRLVVHNERLMNKGMDLFFLNIINNNKKIKKSLENK